MSKLNKQKKALLIVCILLTFILAIIDTVFANDAGNAKNTFVPTTAENQLLENFRGRTVYLGLDPFVGIEHFGDGDSVQGYIIPLVKLMEEQLNLKIKIIDDKSWAQVYNGLHAGEIDLLLGANPTEERFKIMSFTKSIYSVPYTLLAKNNHNVHTIGDLHNKRVGFIHEDIGMSMFASTYDKIDYDKYVYPDQTAAIMALLAEEIDGFITSGGDVVYDYTYHFPGIYEVARVDSITSEMTLSGLKANEAFIEILERFLQSNKSRVDGMIKQSRQMYIRKLINLTPEEIQWLSSNPVVKVGVATNYLPIDYFDGSTYKGVAGHYFMSFADLVGIEVKPIPGDFSDIYSKALKGEVDLLNMAKTEERQANFVFTEPISDERDIIYGLRKTPYVNDIYGLEGKRVAVIDGFWQEKYLERNLRSVTIVTVKSIEEALSALESGRADYFIETPAVAEFYIDGLGYNEIIKKGVTSADSFLYFGALKSMAPLISIFNKVNPLISYSESKDVGAQSVPPLRNIANARLFTLLLGTVVTIVFLTIVITRVVRKMSRQAAEMLLMKERERLIYLDPLTQLYNRNYFNHIESTMDSEHFPQYLVMTDLNDLKIVNDRYGHLAGDQLIKEYSAIFKALDSDCVAIRMGGDEFVLWIKDLRESEVQSLIQRLRFKCQHAVIYDHGSENKPIVEGIIVSAGYSMRKDASKTIEQCLKEADLSMYQDKMHIKSSQVPK